MAATDTRHDEHRALTEACGLVDRSERGKLALTGGDARTFLAGQISSDVEGLQPGAGQYAALLTHKGKMRGDLRILATEDCELLLDCERGALQALFDTIRVAKIGFDVELHKRTLQRGLLSLVGPRARAVAGTPDLGEAEHAHAAATLAGRPVRLVATDLGVDVLCDAPDTEAVGAALVDAGATAVSEAAAEVVRVASGRPRYGVDLDESVIPQEAGLNERAVSFTKGCYVGQETVARLHWRGKPNRHLRGLRLSAPVPDGTPLVLAETGKEVGRVSSSVVHPVLGAIALALVRREAQPGAVLAAGGDAAGTVTELPF